MISWISNWAQGIIMAVIIATIIEMILPKGSIKKYIKVIIGIYILFTIVSPIIEKISGGKVDFNNVLDSSAYAKDIEESNNKINKKLEANNSRTIKDIYVENLETDIKEKLKNKGYEVDNLYIKVKDDENYTIEDVKLKLYKSKKKENTINNIDIQVNISNQENGQNLESASSSEEKEIKKYLSEEYGISSKIITVE